MTKTAIILLLATALLLTAQRPIPVFSTTETEAVQASDAWQQVLDADKKWSEVKAHVKASRGIPLEDDVDFSPDFSQFIVILSSDGPAVSKVGYRSKHAR